MYSVLPFLPRLWDATLLTLYMFAIIAALSLLVTFTCALAVKFYVPSLRYVMAGYSAIFRGVPELIVLFAAYFALPQFGLALTPITAVVVSFVLVRAAYDYELIRAVLEGLDRGQIEASRALGLPREIMIWRVVLPQISRLAIGPWVTQSIGSLKSLSLASAVSVTEIMQVTRQGIVATGKPFEFVLFAAILYGAISSILMVAELFLDRRASRFTLSEAR